MRIIKQTEDQALQGKNPSAVVAFALKSYSIQLLLLFPVTLTVKIALALSDVLNFLRLQQIGRGDPVQIRCCTS